MFWEGGMNQSSVAIFRHTGKVNIAIRTPTAGDVAFNSRILYDKCARGPVVLAHSTCDAGQECSQENIHPLEVGVEGISSPSEGSYTR